MVRGRVRVSACGAPHGRVRVRVRDRVRDRLKVSHVHLQLSP